MGARFQFNVRIPQEVLLVNLVDPADLVENYYTVANAGLADLGDEYTTSFFQQICYLGDGVRSDAKARIPPL